MMQWLIAAWRDNKGFILFIVLMLMFRSAIADWNEVPTGSMKPTIIEGDRILVNKMAYDVRVPFTHLSLLKLADPARGDIIVFDSKVSEKRLVKRVAGIPGDIVEMKNNILFVNGTKLNYEITMDSALAEVLVEDRLEDLLGVKHRVRVKKQGGRLSSFPLVIVPENHYLALGDNRDNSADSRVIGFVPRNEIVGRSKSVVLSLNYNNYHIPRSNRFFHTL